MKKSGQLTVLKTIMNTIETLRRKVKGYTCSLSHTLRSWYSLLKINLSSRINRRDADYCDLASFVKEEKRLVIFITPSWDCERAFIPYKNPYEYDPWSDEEILSAPIKNILNKNVVVFLWVPSLLLKEGMELLNKWGLTYKSSFIVRNKKSKRTLFNQLCHEFILVGTRGVYPPEIFNPPESILHVNSDFEMQLKGMQLIDCLYPNALKIKL